MLWVGLGVPEGEVWAAGHAALQTSPADSSSLRSEVETALLRSYRYLWDYVVLSESEVQADRRIRRRGEVLPGLLSLLDEAAVRIPGDDYVVGHRVGARLRHVSVEGALQAARACEGSRWWCLELEGTVLHYMGEVEAADSVFRESLSHMPAEKRCERESVGDLLGGEALQQYELRTCAGRRPINDRFWWLAEPLYIVPGHDRRTEHRARFVVRDWNRTFQTFLWNRARPLSPSDGCHGGPHVHPEVMPGRRDADGYRVESRTDRIVMHSARNFPRWAIRLTQRPRWGQANCNLHGVGYAFAPDWPMLEEPLGPSLDGWSFERRDFTWTVGRSTLPELYDPPYGPMSALDQQVGFLRRGDLVVVAAATSLAGTPLAAAGEATVGVVLARDEHDEPVMVLDEGAATEGTHRFAVRVPEARYLVSVEAVTDDAGAGRARFGAGLPEGGEGGLALSDVLLFEWAEEAPEESLDGVQPRMLPTTRLEEGAEVGLYWEVYGTDADQPLTIAVRTRPEDPGLLSRIGRALRLTRGDDGVQVSWEDAADAGPHTSRTLRVDLGGLPAGQHTLEVTVETPDGRATATREIVIGEG